MPARTPVVIVENASLPDTKTLKLTLGELPRAAELDFAGPVLILLGDVYAEASAQTLRPTRRARSA
jgi:siroheme synthase